MRLRRPLTPERWRGAAFPSFTDRLARVALGRAPAVLTVLALPLSLTAAGERQNADGAMTAEASAGVSATVEQPAALPALAVPAVAQPPVDVAAEVAVEPEEPPEPPVTAPPPPDPDACRDALAWVANAGLPLPPGVGYHCPSTQFAHHGAACWNASPCRGGPFIAINLELIGDRSTEYVRHVVAHEVCHILDFRSRGWTTEADADACAAAHGA